MVEIQDLRVLEVFKVHLVCLENMVKEVVLVQMEQEECQENPVLRVTEVLMGFLVYQVKKDTGEIVDHKDHPVLLGKME